MKVQFPEPKDININMMPIVMGRKNTIPEEYHGYLPIIEACNFEKDSIVYLTIHESKVEKGKSQRRGGIHTESFKMMDNENASWGGGSWGGKEGLYMASTDGACRIWDTETSNVDFHGGVLEDLSSIDSFKCEPSTLYWMTDKTPHEALPSDVGYRQFIRVVSSNVSQWFSEHNTPNPLGIKPNCPITTRNKFRSKS